MNSIKSEVRRLWLLFWRVFPFSLWIMGGVGFLMKGASEAGRISPSFAYLGRLFLVAVVVTWLLGLIRLIRQPQSTAALDVDAYLVEGEVPPWPKTRLLTPWMVGAILLQLCIFVGSIEEVKHIHVLLDAEAKTCEVNAAKVYEDEDTLRVDIRVITQDKVQSRWLPSGDKIKSHADGKVLIKKRYQRGSVLKCFRSSSAAYHITLRRPTESHLLGWVAVVLSSFYTLCLLAIRQWRGWVYRGGANVLHPTRLRAESPALQAAFAAIGPDVPAGFEVHVMADGDLVVGFVRVGSEEMDAFLSIFNCLLGGSVVLFPLLAWHSIAESGWGTAFWLLLVGLFMGVFVYVFLPMFLRNCLARTVLILRNDDFLVNRKVLFWNKSDSCSRRAIQCVTQVQDGGHDSDSFPSWGLMVHAHEQLELLQREEPHRSRWLGQVIAAWAAVPYHHAGPYES